MLYLKTAESLPLEVSCSVAEFFMMFSFDRVVLQKKCGLT